LMTDDYLITNIHANNNTTQKNESGAKVSARRSQSSTHGNRTIDGNSENAA